MGVLQSGSFTEWAKGVVEQVATINSGLSESLSVGTVGPQPVAGAGDMAAGGIWEVTVNGSTFSNLWENPNGSSQGMTVTPNSDGSVTVSGTPAEGSNPTVYTEKLYGMRAGETYTLGNEGVGPGYGFYLWPYDKDGNRLPVVHLSGSALKAFTAPSDTAYYRCGFQGLGGQEMQSTRHVSLREGDTANPWTVPGVHSATSVKVISTGENLLDYTKLRGSLFQVAANGTVSYKSGVEEDARAWSWGSAELSCVLPSGNYNVVVDILTPTDFPYQGMIIYGDGQGIVSNQANTYFKTKRTAVQPFYLPRPMEVRLMSKYVGGTVRFAIVPAGQSAVWSAYSGESHDIPLPSQHPYLAGVQNGVRDGLTVRWDGTAELNARVEVAEFDGSDDEIWLTAANDPNAGFLFSRWSELGLRQPQETLFAPGIACSALPPVPSAITEGNGVYFRYGQIHCFVDEIGSYTPSDLPAFRAWLSEHPLRVAYVTSDPRTYWWDGSSWSTSRPPTGSVQAVSSHGSPTYVRAFSQYVPVDVTVRYPKDTPAYGMLLSLLSRHNGS